MSLDDAAKTLTVETLRRCVAALRKNQVAKFVRPTALMHPETHLEIQRADARAHWYAQHQANRIAKRTGQPAAKVERLFTAETREVLGVRIFVCDGLPRAARGGR